MIREGAKWLLRPPGGTLLDTSSPLYPGLLWYPDLASGPFSAPSDSGGTAQLGPGLFEPLSGKFGTPASGATPSALCKATAKGIAFASGQTTNDFASWAQAKSFQTITKAFSVGGWFRVAAVTAGGSALLVSIPWASGTWVAPFASITLQQNGTGTDGAIIYSHSSGGATECFITAGSGFFQVDGKWHHYFGTRQNLVGKMYLDGKLIVTASFQSDNVVNMNGAGTPQPITIMQRSSTTAGSGLTGECLNAGLWNRCLSPGEVAQLAADPFALYVPPRQRVWMQILPTPKASSDSAALTEAQALTALFTGTDSAALSEAQALLLDSAQADAATLAEASSIVAAASDADSATLSESSTLAQLQVEAGADTATLAEAALVEATPAGTDSATLAEAQALLAALAQADLATLAESQGLQVAAGDADAATLAEGASLAASLAWADLGTLAETQALEAALDQSDAAALTEAAALTVGLAQADSATLSESADIAVGDGRTIPSTLTGRIVPLPTNPEPDNARIIGLT